MKNAIFALLALTLFIAGCSGSYAPGAADRAQSPLSVPSFPESIGSYVLEETKNEQTDCNTFEKGTKDVEGNELGIEGQVCTRGYILRYIDEATARVMFVHLIQFTEGKDLMKNLMLEVYPGIYPGISEKVEGINAYRMEKHELFWFTSSNDFGEVLIQYGSLQAMPDGSTRYSYPYTANANNDVAQYFLGRYPAE